jgi:AraC-like DNA-binding protein
MRHLGTRDEILTHSTHYNQSKKNFGACRGLLRALLIKEAKLVEQFASQHKISVSELLQSDVFVPEPIVSEFWKLVEKLSADYPLLAIEAASLFHFTDLGERGWLLSTARNLSAALKVIQDFFPEFTINQIDSKNRCTLLWLPNSNVPQLVQQYFTSIFLNFLLGQGIHLKDNGRLTLPAAGKGSNAKKVALLKERFSADFGVSVDYGENTIELTIDSKKTTQTFRSADEAMHQFFMQRCMQQETKLKSKEQKSSDSRLQEKVRELFLRNLASPTYNSRDLAADLGTSIRTLERSLARENLSVRLLKQEVQMKTAKEMLSMGVRAKEVAAKVGFEDVTAFSRAFHKWTGISPSHFKKKRSNDA